MIFALVTARDNNPLDNKEYQKQLQNYNTFTRTTKAEDKDCLRDETVCYIEINTLDELIKLQQDFQKEILIQLERYTEATWDSYIKEKTLKIRDDYLE